MLGTPVVIKSLFVDKEKVWTSWTIIELGQPWVVRGMTARSYY